MPPITTPPSPKPLVRQSWVSTMSRRRSALAGLLVAVVVFLAGGLLDWLVARRLVSPKVMMVGGAAVALFVGFLFFQILCDAHDRHQAMLDRLQSIADINHHIRNALQVISYHAHSQREHTEKAIGEVDAAITRIELVLREVLPEQKRRESDSRLTSDKNSHQLHPGNLPRPARNL